MINRIKSVTASSSSSQSVNHCIWLFESRYSLRHLRLVKTILVRTFVIYILHVYANCRWALFWTTGLTDLANFEVISVWVV